MQELCGLWHSQREKHAIDYHGQTGAERRPRQQEHCCLRLDDRIDMQRQQMTAITAITAMETILCETRS
eukprot:5539113-Amphidinium_carterae.1